MPKPEQVYKFQAFLLRSSDRAVLAHFDEIDEDVWLPLSQILNGEDLFNSDSTLRAGSAEIELPEWLAKATGLI